VRRHAAAKTGTNYDEVEIESILLPAAAGGASVVGFPLPIP